MNRFFWFVYIYDMMHRWRILNEAIFIFLILKLAVNGQERSDGKKNIPKLRTYIRYNPIRKNNKVYTVVVYSYACVYALKHAYLLIFQKSAEFRICLFCDENSIENVEHFFFHCNPYNQLREKLYTRARSIQNNFQHIPLNDQFKILIKEKFVKLTAEFLYSLYTKGRKTII